MPNIIRKTTIRLGRLLLLLCIMASALPASADERKEVIIACDWDYAPYEYINIDGEPDGYCVDVLRTILNNLDIHYKFLMKARRLSVAAFRRHEADLVIDYRNIYDTLPFYRTAAPIGYYQIMAAHHPDQPNITSLKDLRKTGAVVFNSVNDSIARRLLGEGADSLNIEYRTPREALSGIANNEYHYYLWGEEPLKWKMKEYNLSNSIVISKIEDVPASELHIVGYDKKLIDEIGSQFARLQQSGEIDRLRDKWFHSEELQKHTSPMVFYVALAVVLLALFFLSFYRLAKRRVRSSLHRNEELTTMMHHALSMGEYKVLTINCRRNLVTNLHGNAMPEEGMTQDELLAHIHPDNRETILEQWDPHRNNDKPLYFNIRFNNGTEEEPRWDNITGYSYLERNEAHRVENIIITVRNITQQLEEERADQQMASRYRKMFDTSLVAMSFYDKDGYLIDFNNKMRELINLNKDIEEFFRNTSFFDLELMKDDFVPASKEFFHSCQHMRYPEMGIDKYIEYRVKSVFGENGEVIMYVITARDITDERAMYLDLTHQNKALLEAEETNSRYEEEMRVLMENCNMYVWRYDLATDIISFSRSLGKVEFTRTMKEHIESMYEDEVADASNRAQNLLSIDHTFNTLHHFRYTPISDKPSWQATSGMALTDENGKITGLFGIVRDVTDLMEAQERLKEETARAENSAMLKATFLANMTHELRTPLNSIVGFSDLLHMVDTTEERKEFIRIIRNNCDMLMRLINDIFEASNMDIKPLEIKPERCDFAQFFNITCQSLAERVQDPNVEFIVENPYDSFITLLDSGRMQQVITNFVTNAVKYTHQGHIRVGYRYQQEPDGERQGIYMYCEDTGDGIPKEKQKRVFDRFVKLNDFVQGTGLGLSICKSIADRSNGCIGLESEGEGKGCTFWIWVPCNKIQ